MRIYTRKPIDTYTRVNGEYLELVVVYAHKLFNLFSFTSEKLIEKSTDEKVIIDKWFNLLKEIHNI